jgi:hypothetical protein
MLSGQDREQSFREQPQALKFVPAHVQRKRDDSHIQASGTKLFEQKRGDLFHDRDACLRPLARKARQNRWQEIRRDRRNHAHGNGAAYRALSLDNFAACGLQALQDGAGPRQKGVTEFRQPDAAAEAVKEPHTQFVFQLANLLVETRGGSGFPPFFAFAQRVIGAGTLVHYGLS